MERNKIYYGEYSLKHWIDLILSGNIVLPEYQRSFVWDKDNIEDFIESFKSNYFVMPVTIGSYKRNGENKNLLLDGQQRLTSVLLAYFKIFPKKECFKTDENTTYAGETDFEEDEPEESKVLRWTFNDILNLNKSVEELKEYFSSENTQYSKIDYEIDSSFFENNYLGFSYIVPKKQSDSEYQRMYSYIFRNINTNSVKLLPQESRESLYYMNPELAGIFHPNFTSSILVNNKPFDFTRCLTFLSQYKRSGEKEVAKGYKNNLEDLYEDFINKAVLYCSEKKQSSKDSFSLTFLHKNENINQRLETLEKAIKDIGLPKKYKSIIEADIYFFGLIYCVVFLKKEIKAEESNSLLSALSRLFEKEKDNKAVTLTNLRSRIVKSIGVYSKYVK